MKYAGSSPYRQAGRTGLSPRKPTGAPQNEALEPLRGARPGTGAQRRHGETLQPKKFRAMTRPPTARDFTLLLTLSVIWGSSFALIKVAVATVPPFTLATGRVAVAAAVLLILQRLLDQPMPGNVKRWSQFTVVGILGNAAPFVLIGYGEIKVDSGLAATLIGVMPVCTVVFAHLFRVERGLGWRKALGVGCGLTGLIVLVGPAMLKQLANDVPAHLALVTAAASYAATAVYARHLTQTIPTVVLASGTMVASTVLMLPLALIIDAPWALAPTAGAVAATCALGLFATALASLIYFKLLASAGPTFAAMINYLIPAFGVLLGVVWLGERVQPNELAALGLILAGVALARTPPAPQSS